MQRRDFITSSLGAGAAALTAFSGSHAQSQEAAATAAAGSTSPKFKLKYGPHFGMFRNHAGKDPIDQLKFAADQGFHAWEDNGMMRKPPELQTKIGETMQQLGMTMGVFVSMGIGGPDFVTKTDKGYQDNLRKSMAKAVETAKRVNAKWTTVVPGKVNQRLEDEYMMANCVKNLKVMSEVCEPAGLTMVLEPLNWWANHPGLYLVRIPQAYMICKAVDSPSCKILDDLYHQQISEGNLIPNMEKAWDEIAYIQVGDNPGRKEPTTGEINYRNIFQWLHKKGYQGVIGMEHGNSQKGKEGEEKLIAAYRQCDDF
ncbi:MAG: TIM barrel protein [Lentisphaerae bacterium]|jgi:hydroxypyruvate isomerase|nr:TIM barrel protein [Lentisphaerota bacterium]MBT4822202.1 TIM barrel protein [Lentisphaerota bacterium]MBT5609348.1 TIM barrel protein [Lentisphaerota bacterium]MBT7058539.1 TIM barrel protein [Lentisphaerota bacterium]MBT7841089.1 TIM barrel protein [Lentisphaerota bacterium]